MMKLRLPVSSAAKALTRPSGPPWIETKTVDINTSSQVLQALNVSLTSSPVKALDSIYSTIERGAFRLLDLESDVERPAIPSCHLRQAALASEKYVAVSYTWMSSEYIWYGQQLPSRSDLRINGTAFRLPSRVALILAMLFHVGVRTVWMDAICINQVNELEKGHQVARMDRIFLNALEVVMFLGKPNNRTDSTLRILEKSASLESWSVLDYKWPDWDGVRELANHEYWHRAWVLQEIAHRPKRRRLFCGNRILTAAATDDLIPLLCAPELRLKGTYLTCIVQVTLESSHSLLQLLGRTRDARCTDIRDAIYAKIRLTLGENFLGEPDYTEPASRLFVRFAMENIKKYQNLEILRYVQDHRLSDLPSWVPDWTPEEDVAQYNFISYHYPRRFLLWLRSIKTEFTATFSEDGRELQVQGRILTQMPGADEFRAKAKSYFWTDKCTLIEAFCEGLRANYFLCHLQTCDLPVVLARKEDYYIFLNKDKSSQMARCWMRVAVEGMKGRLGQSSLSPWQWFRIR